MLQSFQTSLNASVDRIMFSEASRAPVDYPTVRKTEAATQECSKSEGLLPKSTYGRECYIVGSREKCMCRQRQRFVPWCNKLIE